MDNKEKNIVDKFLDKYETITNNQVRYKKVYQRPSKVKSLMGFVFWGILFVLLLFMFVFSLLYLVIMILVFLAVLYYGINLFTEKGFGLPKRVPVDENDDLK